MTARAVPVHRAATLLGAVFCCFAPANASLSPEEFRNPPVQARPAVLWTWLNGHVDRKQITRELEEMKAKGLRGAIIWDLGSIADPAGMIPRGPAFLGPESIGSIHHAMDEAQRLGLELGMVASSSWNAGGPWIKREQAGKELRWSETRVKGPRDFSGVLPLPEKTTGSVTDIAVLALPHHPEIPAAGSPTPLRLDSRLDAGGRLTWSVPEGEWNILRFVCRDTGHQLICPSPNSKGLMVDHLSKEATAAHFNHILDVLRRGRKDLEPLKVLMLDSYEVPPTTDWTPRFVEEFVRRNGYDPAPWLPVLAGWSIGDETLSARFRHDYRKAVGDLVAEDHFAEARTIVHRSGLQLLAEAGHGGYPRVDPLKALGASDIPMGEFWNHRKNWVTKEAASAAHIYGKRLVNAESFTGWQHWQDGPAAYKRLFDIALCAGLNQATFHTFAHNPPDAGLPGFAYHAGEHFNVNLTWWNQAGPMIEDMSRSCHLLQQGLFVADVAAYYGDEAPNLVPARRISPTIRSNWDDDHCAHCGLKKPVDLGSLGPGYDYDYLNEEILLQRMEARDGKLVLPDGMSYRVLVLPDRETISPEALRRIGELVEAGATVIGRKPERSNSLRGYPACDEEVRALAGRIWGDCDGVKVKSRAHGKGRVIWNIPLRTVLAELGVAPDFTVESGVHEEGHIDYIHRSTGDEEIYFVSNSALTRARVTCRFRVGPGYAPEFWRAEDGSISPCHLYETMDGSIRLPLDLPPASSVFVVFRKDQRPDHLVEIGRPAGGAAAENRPEPGVIGLEPQSLRFRAWEPGTYTFETAGGRRGRTVVGPLAVDLAIGGAWELHFPEGRGAPASVTLDPLIDWTAHSDPGVRHFSGTADYRKTFELSGPAAADKEPLLLCLGAVREVATVTVNGQRAGILWKAPYQVDIRPFVKPGANRLEIAVTNSWNNRLVGDRQSPPGTRVTRTNLEGKFNAQSPLLSSGLLGPVTLLQPVSTTVGLE